MKALLTLLSVCFLVCVRSILVNRRRQRLWRSARARVVELRHIGDAALSNLEYEDATGVFRHYEAYGFKRRVGMVVEILVDPTRPQRFYSRDAVTAKIVLGYMGFVLIALLFALGLYLG